MRYPLLTRTALLLCLIVSCVAVDSAHAAAPVRDDTALWRPRLPTPAIVALDSAEHRSFVAELRAPQSARDWHASIANDLRAWPCEVVSAKFAKINRGTEPGWLITVRIPADAPPEFFGLTITSNDFESVQPQSVGVCTRFDEDFYLLHISDEQIVNEVHTDPSGQYYRTVGTAEEMRWMQEPINLIHPRFVCITGDQIDYNGALDGWNNWHNWGYEPGAKRFFSETETRDIENRLSVEYMQCHRGYAVPYVEAPGNHDVTPRDKKLLGTSLLWHPISVEAYEHYFGQRTWSCRMGDFYVLMHDWSERYLKDWAAADFASAVKDPSIKFRLIGQHFFEDQGFVPESGCDLMLVGHGHRTATLKTSPYYIYEDGPAFVYGKTGFFNFRRTNDGWTCDQTKQERDEKTDCWHLFTDNGEKKLVRADQPDSMAVTTNSVTITNDLPTRFYDGRVRFILPRGDYPSVTNGKVLAQYACHDGKQTAVLVKVDIPAKGSVTVTVAPPATPATTRPAIPQK